MLDAILLPIGEGNRVLGLIRGGNLREKVDIACKGDHEKMKNAINGVHGWLTRSGRLCHEDRQRRHDRGHGQGLRARPDPRVAGAVEEQYQRLGRRRRQHAGPSLPRTGGWVCAPTSASTTGDYRKIVEGSTRRSRPSSIRLKVDRQRLARWPPPPRS